MSRKLLMNVSLDPIEPTTLQITNITGGTFSADWSIPYTTNKPVVKHYYSTWYGGSDASTSWLDRTNQVTTTGTNSYSMSFLYNQFVPGTKSPAIKVVDADGNIAIKTFTLVIK